MEEQVKTKKKSKTLDVYENIEYIAIYKNKQQLEVLEGNQINGKTKTDLQKYLGNKYGAGTYRLSIKFVGDSKNIVGSLAGIVTQKKEQDNKLDVLLERIEQLEQLTTKSNNYDLTSILTMKDEAYKIQIEFYRERLRQLEEEIKKLKEESSNDNTSDLITSLLPILLKQKNEIS